MTARISFRSACKVVPLTRKKAHPSPSRGLVISCKRTDDGGQAEICLTRQGAKIGDTPQPVGPKGLTDRDATIIARWLTPECISEIVKTCHLLLNGKEKP